VTALGFEDDRVILGDPLSGLDKLSLHDFEDMWDFVGRVLKREPVGRKK
jgi:hypothetical protein